MCVMTSYDTQKFNLHHGSFGGAKGFEDRWLNDLNIGVHHKQRMGWLWRFDISGDYVCDDCREGDGM